MSNIEKSNSSLSKGFEFDTSMGLDKLKEVAQEIIDSGLCPSSYDGNPGGLIAVGQMGQELGFTWMAAINNIDNIQGKPTLSYRAVGALLHKANYGVNWIRDFAPEQNGEYVDYATEVEIVDYNLLDRYKAEIEKVMGYPEDVRALFIDSLNETKSQIKRRMTYRWSDANSAGYLDKGGWKRLPQHGAIA